MPLIEADQVSAAPSPSPVVGHVYVNDNNTSGVNTIGAFDRHADGTPTPMPGSPFVTGGLSSPATTFSQGELQLSSDGSYLLAVDRGSNQISVLRVKPDGSLELVGDAPVCSNGVNLTELPNSPTPGPAEAEPVGIVVT